MTTEIWPRILLNISVPEYAHMGAFNRFWQIANQGWPLAQVPPGRVDQQRNMAIRIFLRSEATHLVILDFDHFHPPDIVHQLAQQIQANPDWDVLCGLTFSRHDGSPNASVVGKDSKPIPLTDDLYTPGDVVKCYSAGPGASIISRHTFETIGEPYFAYSYTTHTVDGGIVHPGTDYWFSKRCFDEGITMLVHTGIISPHVTWTTVP